MNQVILIAVSWQKDRHSDSMVFHARILDDLVIIEPDNWEEGLSPLLIEAGIPDEKCFWRKSKTT